MLTEDAILRAIGVTFLGGLALLLLGHALSRKD